MRSNTDDIFQSPDETRVFDDNLLREALPGLPPIYEESDNETLEASTSSQFNATDSGSSFTYPLESSYDVENHDRGSATPDLIASVVIPEALLNTLSITRDWQPSAPTRRRSTVAEIVGPQLARPPSAKIARARPLSVALGVLGRNTATKQGDWVDGVQRAKALRKTSLPVGRESCPTELPSTTKKLSAGQLGSKLDKKLDKPAGHEHPFNVQKIVPAPSNSTQEVYQRNYVPYQPFGSEQISPLDSRPTSAGITPPRRMNSSRNYFSNVVFRASSARQSQDTARHSQDVEKRSSGPMENVRHQRKSTVAEDISNLVQIITAPVANAAATVTTALRKSSLQDVYEKAKVKGQQLQREPWAQTGFEYTVYLILFMFVYFVLVGLPLWKGAVYWLWWVVAHKFVIAGGFSITVGLAAFYAFAPLLVLFEPSPPLPTVLPTANPTAHDVALLIPCYKSARLIGNTLDAALKIFPPSSIFVLANGNSPVPLDDTEEVCRPYGVNHIWSPMGSKIIAQFVGCYAAKDFRYVLMIDDDCTLPPNFPIVTDRMTGKIKSIGYTIKSVGPNSSKGTLCQQAQDMEYKLSGIQRAFAGVIGSATFPHGAISIWDRKFLIKTFHQHPGFSVSEDWFFGHAARQLGSRITMCTSIFVETETPASVFFSSGGSRGGFGEMTVFKQRFSRWNFFFVNGLWYNMDYIVRSWRLGFWELGAKIFVFQEVYETLLYLLSPFMLPISFLVRPSFCSYLLLGTLVMYVVNVLIFNEIHLRRKNERIGWKCLWLYYLPYKVVLTGVNVASCYWSLYKYARYFAKRHPKIVESEKAIEVVLRLEENEPIKKSDTKGSISGAGRRLTVTAVNIAGGVVEASQLEKSPLEGSRHVTRMATETSISLTESKHF